MRNLAIASLFVMSPLAYGAVDPSQAALPESEAQLPSESEQAHQWGLDTSLFKSFSGEAAVSSARFVARRFVTESASLGIDLRHWGSGSYPLERDAGSGTWGTGINGEFGLFRGRYLGAFVGASFLWVPAPGQIAFAPEANLKWFASHWIAVGLAYTVLTDLGSSFMSFDPPASGQSRQSLGLQVSVYL
jgi:hypothetical protein